MIENGAFRVEMDKKRILRPGLKFVFPNPFGPAKDKILKPIDMQITKIDYENRSITVEPIKKEK